MLSRLTAARSLPGRLARIAGPRGVASPRIRPPAAAATATLQSLCRAYSPSSVKEVVPEEDYYHGHLMADHLEYLEDMIDHCLQLQETARIAKDAHAAALAGGARLRASDVDRLVARARERHGAIAARLDALQDRLAANRRSFAVDAPDGEADWHVIDELEKVNEIIEEAARK